MPTIDTVIYTIGDELEPLQLWWSANGSLVDFSVTHSYSATLALVSDSSHTNVFGTPKTTGFTGAAGSGIEGDGTPNLTIDWSTTGELNTPTVSGLYELAVQATRTSDSRRRTGYVLVQLRT